MGGVELGSHDWPANSGAWAPMTDLPDVRRKSHSPILMSFNKLTVGGGIGFIFGCEILCFLDTAGLIT